MWLGWWFGCRVFGLGGAVPEGSGPGWVSGRGGCTGVSVAVDKWGYLGIPGVGCGEGVSGPFARGTFALKCGSAVSPSGYRGTGARGCLGWVGSGVWVVGVSVSCVGRWCWFRWFVPLSVWLRVSGWGW